MFPTRDSTRSSDKSPTEGDNRPPPSPVTLSEVTRAERLPAAPHATERHRQRLEEVRLVQPARMLEGSEETKLLKERSDNASPEIEALRAFAWCEVKKRRN